MKTVTTNINRVGKWVAILSFIIGTIFLRMSFILKVEDIVMPAFFYVVMAAAVNIIIVIILIVDAFKDKENRQKYLETVVIMLLNIPIVALYLFVVFNF